MGHELCIRSVIVSSVLALAACGPSSRGRSSGGADAGPAPPPSVDELSPVTGPYGTLLSVTGAGLGSPTRTNVELVLGGIGEIVLTPKDPAVVSWSEHEIRFQFPFPAEGQISIETPEGAALAGDFVPSWVAGPSRPSGPALEAIASVSPRAGTIAVLLASGTLLVFDDQEVTEHSVDAGSADLQTATLFVSESGAVEALALTSAPPYELIHLASDEDALIAQPTGITGDWSERLLAGSYAWLRDAQGWWRVSADSGSFAIDAGPIADPAPSDGLHAAAATNDGALHVVWNVETGNLIDDMEAPHMARVPPGGTSFDAGTNAGASLDDYLTVLELEGRGAGMRLRWCGSDVDPVLNTPREEACRTAYISSEGTRVSPTFQEDDTSRYVFTGSLVGGAYCGPNAALTLSADVSAEAMGEEAIWPCPRLLAVEVDADGYFLPVIVHEDRIYSPRRRVNEP